MGYNFAEGFHSEEESFEEKVPNPEFLLLENRLENFLTNLQTKFETEDSEVIFLMRTKIHREFYMTQYRLINGKIDQLQDKSEELIESPNANEPEVRAQRLEYANQINLIFY